MRLDIVTPERLIYSGIVDVVVVPGVIGEMSILPNHCPLMTLLRCGELRIRKGGEEIAVAIGGGFLEVRSDRIVVLADLAERDDEIDARKVEEAKLLAEQSLSKRKTTIKDKAEMEAALRFELTRLKIAERHKKKKSTARSEKI